ncbi:Na(+)/H(+) exchange regulatory cofactor NHE-RF3 [Anopheles stephensi]|uniref:Na(+)/H(+) exchange regulatory cofactor NHE-RF3 n=1 Tax=Anopheles stephensi TaxID=30069 RepID=UPI0007D546A3|nr:Na(+)/H(+) exchange regulatory cofactor NHE-RF3 [Anopheles stephensi]XP_035893527.1 Na(+)/H(+) exchange regulatory cofactor NHE-RF3 [Anopheles stephensi]XP_035893528.1 Na(+)/H(+) exchange regulatory cofactor NHE-RF3 [Anopheles stephensi]
MTSKGAATTNGSTSPKYEPRLCHVVKRPDFDGYGFNLHAEKGRPGQYIGKVDDGSPAESAGLRQGDRIIEVNGQNITTETHKKVVELIKAVPNETRLLVIDPRADANDLKLALAKAAAGMVSNGTANGTANGHHESNGVKENGVKQDSKDAGSKLEEKASPKSTNGTMAVVNNNNNNNSNNNNNNHSHSNGNGTTKTPIEPPMLEKIIDDTKKVLTVTDGAAVGKMALNGTAPPVTEPTKTVPPATGEGKKLNLPMTAAEMRAQLAARKKYDPKSEVCDLRKKYEIIQKM